MQQESKADNAELKVKDLERELHGLSSSLRSLEIGEEKALKKENYYEETLRDWKCRLKEVKLILM